MDIDEHDHHHGRKRVLVPGGGLGRLGYEILRQGFRVVVVERSVLMIVALRNILNRPLSSPPIIFYPYLNDSLTNSRDHHRRFITTSFPDIHPVIPLSAPVEHHNMASGENPYDYMSLQCADFVSLGDLMGFKGSFDLVVTCYFLDTAVNLLDYLWTIRNVLQPGGLWINLGPLQVSIWDHDYNRLG